MKKALIKFIVSMFLFGTNGIMAANVALSSHEIVLFRTLFGSVSLLIVFLVSGGRFNIREKKRDYSFIACSGVVMGASWMFLFEGFQQIGVSLTMLMYYCGPVLMMIFAPIIFKEKYTATKIIGFIIVVIGVFLVNGNIVTSGGNMWGIFCGVMSAVTYFLMVTFNKKAVNVSGMENTVIQMVFGFFTVAIFTCCRQGFIINVLPEDWKWLLYIGLINTGLGCYLYFSSFSELKVQTVAILGYLELFSAVVLSAIILKEEMTLLQIIGAICIVGGSMCGELITNKKMNN